MGESIGNWKSTDTPMRPDGWVMCGVAREGRGGDCSAAVSTEGARRHWTSVLTRSIFRSLLISNKLTENL